MLERLPLLSAGISLRPALACEISPAGVLAARQDDDALLTQFVPLPEGALTPGIRAANLGDRARIVTALRTAITAVAERGRTMPGGRTLPGNRALTAIVPDAAVRVLLLDFDTLPSKQAEAISILRFRLRKLVPFEVEDAAISYQVASHTADLTRVLVTVMPRSVLLEYESVIREAGFYAGVVLPSTLAATTLLGAEPALVVNRNGNTLTTAIVRGEELLLLRAQEFEPDAQATHGGATTLPAATGAAAASGLASSGAAASELASSGLLPPGLSLQPRGAAATELLRAEDIRQTVSVALAYYEDTLARVPEALFYIGPGTAREFAALLGEGLLGSPEFGAASLSVRELLPVSGPAPGVPHALLAPVAGALVNG